MEYSCKLQCPRGKKLNIFVTSANLYLAAEVPALAALSWDDDSTSQMTVCFRPKLCTKLDIVKSIHLAGQNSLR